MVPAMSTKTLKRTLTKTVVLGAALLLVAAGLTSCNKKSDAGGAAAPGAAAPQGGSLLIEDVKIGEGTVAAKGKTVSVLPNLRGDLAVFRLRKKQSN